MRGTDTCNLNIFLSINFNSLYDVPFFERIAVYIIFVSNTTLNCLIMVLYTIPYEKSIEKQLPWSFHNFPGNFNIRKF